MLSDLVGEDTVLGTRGKTAPLPAVPVPGARPTLGTSEQGRRGPVPSARSRRGSLGTRPALAACSGPDCVLPSPGD